MGGSVLMLAACTDPVGPTAVKLGFTVEPGNATAGLAIGPGLAVAIQDASGFTVTRATNVVTVTVATGPTGGTLAGTVSVAAVNGVASFADLHLDKAGAGYTLKAAAPQLIGATSTAFGVGAAPASLLQFAAQPSNTMGGATVTPPVVVAVQDAFGNSATGFSDTVTVALGGNPAPGTLSGTTAMNAVNGFATFSDLAIAPASPGYTLTASAAGLTGVTSVPFTIARPSALVRITTATTGAPDPDGYAVCVDSASDGHGGTSCAYGGPLAIRANATGIVTVDTGAHAVLLMGVAAHCTVAGDNPHAIHAARGGTIAVPFAVACAQSTLHVTTATTGVSLDPDGYSFCVDPDYVSDWGFDYYYSCSSRSPMAIGVNGGVTVPVAPGSHAVQLEGVAGNCEVSGENPRSVEATALSEVPFAVTCFATGSVRVTTATSGTDVDPDGYAVCIDRSGTCYGYAPVHANDVVTIPGVIAGLHTVTLSGTAGNCTVSGSTARAVTVPPNGTAAVTFDVVCVRVERIAYSSGGTITVSQLGGSVTQKTIGPGFAPAWSPDGSRLAYECGQNLCAINADGSGFAQLTFDAAGNYHPTWAPDGSKIAFGATHAGVADLYVMAPSGFGVARLTQGLGFVGSPAWSPNGTTIAFDCRVDAGNDDICVVNADGSALVRLTNDPARDYGAAWKPDGSTLAFATTRYGGDEIAFMSVAGGGVTRAGLAGFGPTWSPDGTQLALVQAVQVCRGWGSGCDWYDTSREIFTANADGSGIRYLTEGDQPAWRPHP